jgi:hypothetical protein
MANKGVLVDLRGVLKHAFVKALLDDLPDGICGRMRGSISSSSF